MNEELIGVLVILLSFALVTVWQWRLGAKSLGKYWFMYRTIIDLKPGEVPVFYAPYMPLIVSDVLPESYNPLSQQKALATFYAGQELDTKIENGEPL